MLAFESVGDGINGGEVHFNDLCARIGTVALRSGEDSDVEFFAVDQSLEDGRANDSSGLRN